MKKIILLKIAALLATMTLLFNCTIDDLNLNNESVKNQELSTTVDEETFVSLDKAKEIADSFFIELTEENGSTKSTSRTHQASASIETVSESGAPLMYIINYSDGGFIIMGSSKNYYPVLAYSDQNSFEITSETNGISSWLEETKEAIKTSDASDDTVKREMRNLWNRNKITDVLSSGETQSESEKSSSYSSGEIACWNRCEELMWKYSSEGWNFMPLSQAQQVLDSAGFSGTFDNLCYSAEFNHSPIESSVFAYKDGYERKQVGPLLNTKWHQSAPFNDLCNGKPAGCGAIAIAQVLEYYKYPKSFSWNGYAFNWNNIPVNPQLGSTAQAALTRLIGNAVNMRYYNFGSWSTPNNMETGIRRLGYTVTRANHNFRTVEKQLLNYRRPVIMGGNANNVPLPGALGYIGSSHYWVCDGARKITTNRMLYYTEWQPYENGTFTAGWNSKNSPGVLGGTGYLYFHMKWGWRDGNCDGWFAFNNVNSGSGNFKYSRQDFYITRP